LADALLVDTEGAALAVGVVDRLTAAVLSVSCVDGDRFEFGSITKVLTALSVAGVALQGEIDLDAPIGHWVDAGPNGDVTWRQLSSHLAGLPRVGPSIWTAETTGWSDAYEAWTVEKAEADLRAVQRQPAPRSAYSNLGFEILGVALARACHRPLQEIVHELTLTPLGMDRTVLLTAENDHGTVTPAMHGVPQPLLIRNPALCGAGCYAGPVDDLVALAGAGLDDARSWAAFELTRAAFRPDLGGTDLGMPWFRTPDGIIYHGGTTMGTYAVVAANPARGLGAAVLVAALNRRWALPAVLALLRGDDPMGVRPADVPPTAVEQASELVEDLAAHRFGAARSRFESPLGSAATASREAWLAGEQRSGCCQFSHVATACPHPDGPVVQVCCHFELSTLLFRVAVAPSGRVDACYEVGAGLNGAACVVAPAVRSTKGPAPGPTQQQR